VLAQRFGDGDVRNRSLLPGCEDVAVLVQRRRHAKSTWVQRGLFDQRDGILLCLAGEQVADKDTFALVLSLRVECAGQIVVRFQQTREAEDLLFDLTELPSGLRGSGDRGHAGDLEAG